MVEHLLFRRLVPLNFSGCKMLEGQIRFHGRGVRSAMDVKLEILIRIW